MTEPELKPLDKRKHAAFFLGGPARTGKSTILFEVLRRRPMMAVSSDAIRSAIRNALIAEPYVSIDNLDFSGDVTFRRPGSKEPHTLDFKQSIDDEEVLAWAGVIGLLDHYERRNDTDLIIEGVVITPERIKKLEVGRLTVRAAFVGFTNEGHVDAILAHAQRQRSDWVNKWLQEHDGDDTHIRNWGKEQIHRSQALKGEAMRIGYGFFDLADCSFNEHVERVVDYLLEGEAS